MAIDSNTLPHSSDIILGGSGFAVFASIFYFWIKKTSSKINSDTYKQTAETDIIKTLQDQVDGLVKRLDHAEAENIELNKKLAHLQAMLVEHDNYKLLVERLKSKIEEKDSRYEALLVSSTEALTTSRIFLQERDKEIASLKLRLKD